MRLPYRVKSTTIHRGHVFPEVHPLGREAFLDEIVERVLQDRFDDPWPPASWQHWVATPSGFAVVRVCWEGRS